MDTRVPPPTLNGGLYTGKPFSPNAPWRNFPATPDAGFMTFVNLASAHPPPNARYHVPGGGLRVGNSTPNLPEEYVRSFRPDLNMICVPADARGSDLTRDNFGFAGFYYLDMACGNF
jgi:hypothetical protein